MWKKNYKTVNFPFFSVPPPFLPRQGSCIENSTKITTLELVCVYLRHVLCIHPPVSSLSLRCMSCVCLLIANNFYISFGPVKVDMCIFMLYMFIKSLYAALGAWRMKTINFIAPLTLRSFVQISLSADLISTPHVCCTHSALACSVSHVKFI